MSEGNAPARTYEEHVERALACMESVQRNLWELARICASLESVYGEDITGKFASDIGYSANYVRRLAGTWREWEGRQRSRLLSLKHHTVASASSDPQAALAFAENHELSTRQLEKHIQREAQDPGAGQEQGTVLESVTHFEVWLDCPECGGVGRIRHRPKGDSGEDSERGQHD